MENSYGIGIANRYDMFYGQEDVSDNFEMVSTKKKKDKMAPATVTTTTTITTPIAPKSAEKENKVQPKAQPQATTMQNKAQSQDVRKDQRRGIKEQNNTGINKKDNGEFSHAFNNCGNFSHSKNPSRRLVPKFGIFFSLKKFFFSQKMCFLPLTVEKKNRSTASVVVKRTLRVCVVVRVLKCVNFKIYACDVALWGQNFVRNLHILITSVKLSTITSQVILFTIKIFTHL